MKHDQGRIVIGIGGNIGAGKTTASRYFAQQGAKYVSADRAGWQVLPGIMPALRRKLGKKLGDQNRIDRRRLRRLLFNDAKTIGLLNRLSHPRLKAALKKTIEREKGLVILDAALVFQWPDILKEVDYPILITASNRIKASRAAKKGIGRNLFDRILQVQMDDAEAANIARYIIINCSTKRTLGSQCRRIYKEIIDDCDMQ